ncbi:hypothetical protein CPT_Muldoon_204 [Serratia phage Muldoon]|uniref:Uncharacterized protein n=1 Tax=Serratia phage Muldoon TaxID=2601678 RepID=A0A5P8PHM5_9CAUD|nr:hypothetical protein HYP94_gp186 [Serratia phage Muldoon]QFR56155.1 hypothetical protein CPT_Muldoon_204 [Serratia phage Muldoon]UNA02313.1 hypothetical protein [Serratia phage SP1]WDS61747.1 hypothetical protein [Cronobacter phage vB_Cdu_VP8]
MKPHEFRILVNDLTAISRQYANFGCLRDVISRRLSQDIKLTEKDDKISTNPKQQGLV